MGVDAGRRVLGSAAGPGPRRPPGRGAWRRRPRRSAIERRSAGAGATGNGYARAPSRTVRVTGRSLELTRRAVPCQPQLSGDLDRAGGKRRRSRPAHPDVPTARGDEDRGVGGRADTDRRQVAVAIGPAAPVTAAHALVEPQLDATLEALEGQGVQPLEVRHLLRPNHRQAGEGGRGAPSSRQNLSGVPADTGIPVCLREGRMFRVGVVSGVGGGRRQLSDETGGEPFQSEFELRVGCHRRQVVSHGVE